MSVNALQLILAYKGNFFRETILKLALVKLQEQSW